MFACDKNGRLPTAYPLLPTCPCIAPNPSHHSDSESDIIAPLHKYSPHLNLNEVDTAPVISQLCEKQKKCNIIESFCKRNEYE